LDQDDENRRVNSQDLPSIRVSSFSVIGDEGDVVYSSVSLWLTFEISRNRSKQWSIEWIQRVAECNVCNLMKTKHINPKFAVFNGLRSRVFQARKTV
jgi:hypothetical protein